MNVDSANYGTGRPRNRAPEQEAAASYVKEVVALSAGFAGSKVIMGLDPCEQLDLLSALCKQNQEDGHVSETTVDLVDSSTSAPSASCMSGHVRHDEAPSAQKSDECSLSRRQSSCSSHGGNTLHSEGSTEVELFPNFEADHIVSYLEQTANPILRAVTDAALEKDLLELLSSPIAFPAAAASAAHQSSEKSIAEVQGYNVCTIPEGSIPLPQFSLRPEDHSSAAVSTEENADWTSDSQNNGSGKALIEHQWTARPKIQSQPSSKLVAKVENMRAPVSTTGQPKMRHTSQGNRNTYMPAFLPQSHDGWTVSPFPELQQLTAFDKNLRERSLAIFSATDEQMKRPMKKSRTYSKAIPSRFCHICTRQSKKTSMHAFCLNINRGTCRKAVCEKCFIKFGWDWKAVSAPGSQWLCPHCCNICPKGAQCYNYEKSNDHRPKNELNGAHGRNTPLPTGLTWPSSAALAAPSLMQQKRALGDIDKKANDKHQKPELSVHTADKGQLLLEVPQHFNATNFVPHFEIPSSAIASADPNEFTQAPHDAYHAAMF